VHRGCRLPPLPSVTLWCLWPLPALLALGGGGAREERQKRPAQTRQGLFSLLGGESGAQWRPVGERGKLWVCLRACQGYARGMPRVWQWYAVCQHQGCQGCRGIAIHNWFLGILLGSVTYCCACLKCYIC